MPLYSGQHRICILLPTKTIVGVVVERIFQQNGGSSVPLRHGPFRRAQPPQRGTTTYLLMCNPYRRLLQIYRSRVLGVPDRGLADFLENYELIVRPPVHSVQSYLRFGPQEILVAEDPWKLTAVLSRHGMRVTSNDLKDLVERNRTHCADFEDVFTDELKRLAEPLVREDCVIFQGDHINHGT